MHASTTGEVTSEFFNRFVEHFGDFVGPDSAATYWHSLNPPAERSRAAPLCFGVTEFSVSLQPRGEVTLRWLAETWRRQPFDQAAAAQARAIAHGVFAVLAHSCGNQFPEESFDRLFDLLYVEGSSQNPQPVFRIGYALEFQKGRAPKFRWYAEPRTAGAGQALDRLESIARYLDLGPHFQAADQLIHKHLPGAALRGIGLDLSPQCSPGLKVYYSARGCFWSQLQEVFDFPAGHANSDPLQRFHRLILKGRRRLPPNTVLVAAVLSPALDPETPVMKWDVFLPQLHTGDRLVQERLLRLGSELGIDMNPYVCLWKVVAGGMPPETLCNVHQYASLDLSADGQWKVNVYLRSPQQCTEHMPKAMRPSVLRGSETESSIATSVLRGLVNLADSRENGFSEIAHRMAFPPEAGFVHGKGCCLGSVYQRATVCSTLLRAKPKCDVDEQVLQDDWDFLLSQQDQGSRGWKYFPTLAELPPDADDVAQVLLAFLDGSHQRTAAIFAPIVDLIERLVDPLSGQAPTWLVDPEATDAASQLYRRAIECWWGSGTDAEVVANLGFALHRFDPSRFRPWLKQACNWLSGRQTRGGWWESTWYWGQTYGTWMATRLIAAVNPLDPALSRTADWLCSQAEQDEWQSLPSPALETAFALETAIELARDGLLVRDHALLCRSAAWLRSLQAEDGSWDASPFIRMDTNRAATQRGVGQPKYVSYGSRSLTTAFCLQALMGFLSLSKSGPRMGATLQSSR